MNIFVHVQSSLTAIKPEKLSVFKIRKSAFRIPLQNCGNAQATTAADAFQPEPDAPPSHFMQQGDQNPGSGAGNGMAQRNTGAVHIDPP
jgi:hypothetical protein